MNSNSWFLKIPPQEEVTWFQITSLMIGALGWWILALKRLNFLKSLMELLEDFLALFPEREVLAVIIPITLSKYQQSPTMAPNI